MSVCVCRSQPSSAWCPTGRNCRSCCTARSDVSSTIASWPTFARQRWVATQLPARATTRHALCYNCHSHKCHLVPTTLRLRQQLMSNNGRGRSSCGLDRLDLAELTLQVNMKHVIRRFIKFCFETRWYLFVRVAYHFSVKAGKCVNFMKKWDNFNDVF